MFIQIVKGRGYPVRIKFISWGLQSTQWRSPLCALSTCLKDNHGAKKKGNVSIFKSKSQMLHNTDNSNRNKEKNIKPEWKYTCTKEKQMRLMKNYIFKHAKNLNVAKPQLKTLVVLKSFSS